MSSCTQKPGGGALEPTVGKKRDPVQISTSASRRPWRPSSSAATASGKSGIDRRDGRFVAIANAPRRRTRGVRRAHHDVDTGSAQRAATAGMHPSRRPRHRRDRARRGRGYGRSGIGREVTDLGRRPAHVTDGFGACVSSSNGTIAPSGPLTTPRSYSPPPSVGGEARLRILPEEVRMPPAMHTDAVISVVIIHRDRPDAVGRTIEAFRDQSWPPRSSSSTTDQRQKPRPLPRSWGCRAHHHRRQSGFDPGECRSAAVAPAARHRMAALPPTMRSRIPTRSRSCSRTGGP